MTKQCIKCSVAKPKEHFAKETRSKDGLQRWCKTCQRAWRQANTQRLQDTNRRCRLKKLAQYKRKDRALTLRKYGLTLESYASMLAAQGHACAICHTLSPGGVGNQFHVDHCHITGRVRALLCHHCNKGLGQFQDDPCLVASAAEYLRRHP